MNRYYMNQLCQLNNHGNPVDKLSQCLIYKPKHTCYMQPSAGISCELWGVDTTASAVTSEHVTLCRENWNFQKIMFWHRNGHQTIRYSVELKSNSSPSKLSTRTRTDRSGDLKRNAHRGSSEGSLWNKFRFSFLLAFTHNLFMNGSRSVTWHQLRQIQASKDNFRS